MDFLTISGHTPDKFAINLMDTFFTDEEMKGCLFFKSSKSRSARSLLPQDRVKKLLGTYGRICMSSTAQSCSRTLFRRIDFQEMLKSVKFTGCKYMY